MYNNSPRELLFPPIVVPALPGYTCFEPNVEGLGKEIKATGLLYSPIIAWVVAATADREDGTLLEPNVRPVAISGPVSDLYGVKSPDGWYTIPEEEPVATEVEVIEQFNRILTSNIIDFDAARRGLAQSPPDAA